ncbi:HsdM family class I SAM-dependent methyltransferase [Mycoplasmopsis cynos]|uniref:HsdM family class I SAM-dependent methyltransferase n=1 Tax=Mycoplasmopsis cynos TaxID=171284 RepID=UPI002AFE74C9|nr:N-6 DNA methylase [Mycoplasmopsis cynos]WQQ17625.1 Eco57I restriction-modification methylase domain-containing protein [Mycoplasmopsis cynos]
MFPKYLNPILNKFPNYIWTKDQLILDIASNEVIIDFVKNKWSISEFNNYDHGRIFNLNFKENWSALILVCELLNKGYSKEDIHLEKSWKLGHNASGYCDLVLYKNNQAIYFFEIKNLDEIHKYTSLKNDKSTKQLFSYLYQEKTARVGSFYSFNFINETHQFFNIFINDILSKAISVDDMFDKWNKAWDHTNFILNNNLFDLKFKSLKYSDLNKIDHKSVKIIFNQFLSILRQNSVSDKSNAFDKMINLFIAKVYDELNEDTTFKVNNQTINGIRFQYIMGVDDDLSFLKRLNDLYKQGMNIYMKKDIIDYTDDEINELLNWNKNTDKLRKIIDDLRLKKNNAFSFIEVFDDKTFKENNNILKELVLLLQSYKFKYNNKHQFLGDFFEELLNTSWKQESGQFFTPMPIVDFMIHALPINEKLISNINSNLDEIVPKMIDYASGSGHFIISYMEFIQKCINEIEINDVTEHIKRKIESFKINPFSWANKTILAIEKDYRLSKTTKISTFLNGDGDAVIINGDGINKFNSYEYQNTILYTDKNENCIFDFVIANPPYSVAGFMKNIKNNSITEKDFSLLKYLDQKSTEIEILFIERTMQLLKNKAYAALILPRSFLTANQYKFARDYVLENFKIKAIFESADITFSGTTTSPIILFLEKQKMDLNEINYNLLIINSPKIIFESNEKEKEFLGYEFSKNRNKLGISIKNNNLVKNYSPIVKEFINTNSITKLPKYAFITNISEILIKDKSQNNNLIYTRYKAPKSGFVPLGSLIDEINPKYDNSKISDIDISKIKYLEISDIENGKIKHKNNKHKKSNKLAFSGDILFSSIPNNKKVAIADDTYFVSSAIYVFRIKNKEIKENLYKYIFQNKNNIIGDMNVFLDGFKITYGKINEHNIANNIFIQKDEIIK